MCDVVTGAAVVGGMLLGSAMSKGSGGSIKQPKMPDPAQERARAEAEAAQRANAQLAADQRRRRGGSLLMAGQAGQGNTAPQPVFGDTNTGDDINLRTAMGSPVSRSSTARRSSLMSRGSQAAPQPGRGPQYL